MSKKQIIASVDRKQSDDELELYKFLDIENFTESKDKLPFFNSKAKIFFKKINNSFYLVFEVMAKKRSLDAHNAAFWIVESTDLKKVVDEKCYVDILLGFDLDRDREVYQKFSN